MKIVKLWFFAAKVQLIKSLLVQAFCTSNANGKTRRNEICEGFTASLFPFNLSRVFTVYSHAKLRLPLRPDTDPPPNGGVKGGVSEISGSGPSGDHLQIKNVDT